MMSHSPEEIASNIRQLIAEKRPHLNIVASIEKFCAMVPDGPLQIEVNEEELQMTEAVSGSHNVAHTVLIPCVEKRLFISFLGERTSTHLVTQRTDADEILSEKFDSLLYALIDRSLSAWLQTRPSPEELAALSFAECNAWVERYYSLSTERKVDSAETITQQLNTALQCALKRTDVATVKLCEAFKQHQEYRESAVLE